MSYMGFTNPTYSLTDCRASIFQSHSLVLFTPNSGRRIGPPALKTRYKDRSCLSDAGRRLWFNVHLHRHRYNHGTFVFASQTQPICSVPTEDMLHRSIVPMKSRSLETCLLNLPHHTKSRVIHGRCAFDEVELQLNLTSLHWPRQANLGLARNA